MDSNKLTVTVENGNSMVISVLDIIENTDENKKYIVYVVDGATEENVYISILEETDTTFSLKTIEDPNELKMVEDFLQEINNENGDV